MAELARKRALRRAQRAVVTRTVNQIGDLLKEEELDKVRLNHKRILLIEKRDVIKALDVEILPATADDQLEEEIERADEVREQLEVTIVQIDNLLREGTVLPAIGSSSHPSDGTSPKKAPPTKPGSPDLSGESPPSVSGAGTTLKTGTTASDGATDSTSAVSTRSSTSTFVSPTSHSRAPAGRVKLPEITLKRFGGDLGKWKTFWDTFESTIHGNPVLSDVEKFTYLQSLLDSPAADAISGLSITADNYEEAVAILTKRYGNSQLIIGKHMEVLLSLEPISSQGSIRQLRRFFDTVETHVRGLKVLGVPHDSYGALLSNTLLKKLPPDVQLIVSRGLPDDSWDLDRIMSLLENELLARERTAGIQPTRKSNPTSRSPHPTAATLVTPSSTNCVYCGQNHLSTNCRTVPSVEGRKQSLKRTGRCYICLRQNHISRNCRSSLKCPQCRGRHHQSICDKPTNSGSTAESKQSSSQGVSTPVMYVNSQTQVLLQTASIVLHDSRSSFPTRSVRAVLDCGSQRSYVTAKVQQELSLSTVRVETVEIKSFGSTRARKDLCNVVKFCIIARDGCRVEMSALVVPHICDAIYNQSPQEIANCYPHLSELDLADDEGGKHTATVEVLIGSDYYWTLVSGRVKRGVEGPIAIETRVGWVLSGPVEERELEESVTSITRSHALRVDVVSVTNNLEDNLTRFWELEAIGISPSEESVHTKFSQQISFRRGRYEVSLPWRSSCRRLPDNYRLCMQRLRGLHRRLMGDLNLLEAYHGVIQDQLRQGIIERVSGSDQTHLERVHYLPHHPVVRQDKLTTKVRV